MHIVWHGSYALYFEDAREEFGRVFGLSYSSYVENGCYAPLVDLQFSYRQPLRHGERARTVITYSNTRPRWSLTMPSIASTRPTHSSPLAPPHRSSSTSIIN